MVKRRSMSSSSTNPFSHLAPDEVRHLAAYLDETGRIADLHRLVNFQWETGGTIINAWYWTHEQQGEVSAFLNDVRRAWAAADRTKEDASKTIALAIRYALMSASLVSLSANVSAVTVASLVKQRRWSVKQGMYYAENSPDMSERARMLAFLAPSLSRHEYLSALRLALEIKDPVEQLWALIGLVHHLGNPQEGLQLLLRTAAKIDDLWLRSQSLAGIGLLQPEPLAGLLFDAAVQVADRIFEELIERATEHREAGQDEKRLQDLETVKREAMMSRLKLLSALSVLLGEAGKINASGEAAWAAAFAGRGSFATSWFARHIRSLLQFIPRKVAARLDSPRRIPQQLHDLFENFTMPDLVFGWKEQYHLQRFPAAYALNVLNSADGRLKEDVAKPLVRWFERYGFRVPHGAEFWTLKGYQVCFDDTIELPDGRTVSSSTLFPVMLTWLPEPENGAMEPAAETVKLLGFFAMCRALLRSPGIFFTIPNITARTLWSSAEVLRDYGSKARGIFVLISSYFYTSWEHWLRLYVPSLLPHVPTRRKLSMEKWLVSSIRNTRVPWHQLEAIRRSAGVVSCGALTELLQIAKTIVPPKYKGLAVISIAEYLPEMESEDAYSEAIKSLPEVMNQFDRAAVMASIPKCIPPRLRAESVELAWHLQNPFARAWALANLGVKFEPGNAKLGIDTPLNSVGDEKQLAALLAILSPYLSGDLLAAIADRLDLLRREEGEVEARSTVARRLAQLGEAERALDTAIFIRNPLYKVRTLSELAQSTAGPYSFELLEKALDIARKTDSSQTAVECLTVLVPLLPGEMLEDAMRFAAMRLKEITGETHCVDLLIALVKVVPVSVNEATLQRLLEVARALKDDSARDKATASMAILFAQHGATSLLIEALATIRSDRSLRKRIEENTAVLRDVPFHCLSSLLARIRDARERVEVIALLLVNATCTLKVPLLTEAFQASAQIQSQYDHVIALLALAPHDIRAADAAAEAVREFPPGRLRAVFIARLTTVFPEEDRSLRDMLLHDIRAISSPLERVRLLSELSVPLTEEPSKFCFLPGWPESERLRAIGLLREAACLIEEPKQRAEWLSTLVEHLPVVDLKAGIEQAIRAALGIVDPMDQYTALFTLASKPQLNGRNDVLAAARAAARKIHDVQERARALARVGSTKDSLEAAITISGPKTRGEVLADIICRVPSVERDNALEVLCKGTEDFTEPDNRVAAKEAAIGRLTERGVIDAAFRVFLTVSDSAARRSCSKILLRRLDAQVAVETIQHVRGWLAILGRGKRSDLMAELREFVPLFHNLDDSLPERVARAALDVCQWWP